MNMMDGEVYTVPRSDDRRERSDRGSQLFPCSNYDRDAHQYAAQSIPAHWHPEMEIFFLVEGKARVILADAEFHLEAGDSYVVNSGVLHAVFPVGDEPCHYNSMVFAPSIIAGAPSSAFDVLYVHPFLRQGGAAWVLRADTRTDADVTALFREAFAACHAAPDGYEFTVRDRLSRIMLMLRERSPERTVHRGAIHEQRMKLMVAWIGEHYAESVTVERIADSAGICVRECQRMFTGILDQSPMQYLARVRVAAAAEALTANDAPIAQIGRTCGLGAPAHFSRQFKQITGMTPRDYRKRYGTNSSS